MATKEEEIGHSRAQSVVLRNLDRIPGRKRRVNGAVISIVCPFHDDRNPSCMLNTAATERFSLGFFACFGCGAKGGWNVLADKLGLEKIKEGDDKQTSTLNHDFEDKRQKLLGIKDNTTGLKANMKDMRIEMSMPFDEREEWRGVSGKLLKKVGALLALDWRTEEQVVILPVKVDGKVVGCIKASWEKKKGQLSYVTSKGESWAKRELLFPYDYAVKMARRKKMRICIVEGPRDALRLLAAGIPAVAIGGSQSWSGQKRDLIIDADLRGVILALDSDQAGESARKMIRKALKNHVDLKQVRMDKIALEIQKTKKLKSVPEIDPGNVPKPYLRIIKQMAIQA